MILIIALNIYADVSFTVGSLTSLRLVQVKVEVVFELLLLSPVNRLLLLALLGQTFFFSARFCQSVGLLTYKQQDDVRRLHRTNYTKDSRIFQKLITEACS